MTAASSMAPDELERSLANLKLERDAIILYDRLASIEKDPRRQHAFEVIATNERRHADIWAQRLRDAGLHVPPEGQARFRVRVIIALARTFGTRAVSDLVQSLEGDEEDAYSAQGDPDVDAIMADEREHAEIWQRLDSGLPAVREEATGHPDMERHTHAPGRARREESWHRSGRTGTLRAAIFGISDGLVSNLALVMGVAGASADERFIVLAGVAGLLAGAFSMAAGEYISMQSQRELFERQIELEREEMKIMPDAEEHELALIYRAKGLSTDEAALVAKRLMQDPAVALDTKIREELGLDPDELGSAWGAATWSFLAFGIGAVLPLIPFLLADGTNALVAAIVLALTALFAVGAGVSLLTGRGLVFSGMRQVAIGAVAAGVTFIVGTLIGVQVG